MSMSIDKDEHSRALKLAAEISTAFAGSDKSTSPDLIVELLRKSYAEIRKLDGSASPPPTAK